MTTPILPLPGHYVPPQQPHHQGPTQGIPPQPPSKPTYSKRGKITIVACVPCRKRKTKCDGKRPECTQCQSREGQCHYDMSEDQRRLTFLRENVEHLAEEKASLEALLWNLGNSPEEEALEILRRLRTGAEPQSLAQHIQAGRSLAQVRRDSAPNSSGSPYPSLSTVGRHVGRADNYEVLVDSLSRCDPVEVDEIIRRLRAQEEIGSIAAAAKTGTLLANLAARDLDARSAIELDFSSQGQTFGLTRTGSRGGPESEFEQSRVANAHTPLSRRSQWTNVTNDLDFIEHLITVYFTWQHSFFQSFPEHLFRRDMETGKTRYCSKFLVNAICAAGCLLSTHPKATNNPTDPRRGHVAFFEEAVRNLENENHSSIPTVAGLFLLCHVEGYRGRLGMTWDYSGRSSRTALDLNLHLRKDALPQGALSTDARIENRAKLHTFWGSFISDQVTSFTLGRLPQIPTNAITVDLPPVNEEEDDEEWIPYGVDLPQVDQTPRPGCRATTFYEVASLSKIVNSTLLMFFAPSETMRGGLLLGEYEKYQSWYSRLPENVKSTHNAPPHVLCLHMYYHAAVLLLFRPFLKAKFTESLISPSEVCREAANAICDIFAAHRALYDTTGLYTFHIHCLLTACTIHLVNLPSSTSSAYLTTACNHFHDMLPINEWAAGSLGIIKGLVQKWNLILPREAEAALFKNDQEDATPGILDDNTDPALLNTGNSSAYAEVFRPHKRNAVMNPSPEGLQKRAKIGSVLGDTGSAPTANMGHQSKQSRNQLSPSDQQARSGASSVSKDSPSANSPAGLQSTAPLAYYMPFLFAPFPNQPAPLLGPFHTSTSSETKWHEEMHKVAQHFDGLTFEVTEGNKWPDDPFMGFGATWQEAVE